MSMKSNIVRVLAANCLTVISSVLVSFIVPIILSVENYSYLKSYTFYVSYILFLSLGFVDGMHCKYAGKEENEINKENLKYEHKVYLISQVIFTLIFVIIGVLMKNVIVILLAFTIIPVNLSWFYKLYYQAIGNFKEYTKASYGYTITYFIINIFLVVFIKEDNYLYYCFSTLIAHATVFLIFEYKFNNSMRSVLCIKEKNIIRDMKIGFFIMCGNLSAMLFYGLDRWFIKGFLDTNSFAYYSFAISMMNVINILVSAISTTLYNYLAKEKNMEEIKKIKINLLILGAICSGAYFVFSAIVSFVLKKYIPALDVISILFSAYPYIIIINAIYINLYKINKLEKKYLSNVLKMVILSIIYNFIALMLFKDIKSISIATTLAFITWNVYSSNDFEELKVNKKEALYLAIVTSSFLFLANRFNWFIGGVSYLFIVIIASIIIYREQVVYLIKMLASVLLRRKQQI